MERVILFPRAFDPPSLEDVAIVRHLLGLRTTDFLARPFFDRVVLCLVAEDGFTDPGETTSLEDRLSLLQRAFPSQPRLEIDASYAAQSIELCADDLRAKYAQGADEVACVVLFEDIAPGEDGQSTIERTWQNGTVFQVRTTLYVVRLYGALCEERILPPRATYLSRSVVYHLNNASVIRRRLRQHDSLEGYLLPEVRAAIRELALYGTKDTGS